MLTLSVFFWLFVGIPESYLYIDQIDGYEYRLAYKPNVVVTIIIEFFFTNTNHWTTHTMMRIEKVRDSRV